MKKVIVSDNNVLKLLDVNSLFQGR
jgi:hypothetical protein